MNPRPYGPEPYALPTALRLSNVYYIFKLRFSQTFLTYINLYNCVFNAIINTGALLRMLIIGGNNMTIHHDKLAYGKLESSSEEISEEKIAEMLKQLQDEEEEENCEKKNGCDK